VQLLTIGILGHYIGSLFDEVKKRPEYIVDELVQMDDRRLETEEVTAPVFLSPLRALRRPSPGPKAGIAAGTEELVGAEG
jgi:hypothetical protein